MEKRLGLVILLVLCPLSIGYAQSASSLQCDATVQDTTMLTVSQIGLVAVETDKLKEQGADARVIITSLAPGQTLDTIIGDMGKRCAEWKSPNGGVKANMLV